MLSNFLATSPEPTYSKNAASEGLRSIERRMRDVGELPVFFVLSVDLVFVSCLNSCVEGWIMLQY